MAADAQQLDVKSALRFALGRVDGNLTPFADILGAWPGVGYLWFHPELRLYA